MIVQNNRVFGTKSRTINVNTRYNPRQNTSGIVLLEMCPLNGLSRSESPWGYYVSGHYTFISLLFFFCRCVDQLRHKKSEQHITSMSNVFFYVGVLYFFFQKYFEI